MKIKKIALSNLIKTNHFNLRIFDQSSFTLIELLVVIVIIGILSSVIFVNFNNAIKTAQDTIRKSDLSAIQKAILAYQITENGVLPIASDCVIGQIDCIGYNDQLKNFLSVIPIDPDPSKHYFYSSSDGINFTLKATLSDGKIYAYNSENGWTTDYFVEPNEDGSCNVASGTINLNSQSCSGRATADAIAFSSVQNNLAGTNSVVLSTTPTGLAVNDQVLIINLQGTSSDYSNVGQYEIQTIAQIDNTTKTLIFYQKLQNTYNGSTQKIMIQRLPHYSSVNVSSGAVLTANAWNNTLYGVLAFTSIGAVTISGTLDMTGKGFLGGAGTIASNNGIYLGYPGTSYAGAPIARSTSANLGGGGSGQYDAGGGGGGHALNGNNGIVPTKGGGPAGMGGSQYSSTNLTRMYLGSGGGGGGGTGDVCYRAGGNGGTGGGIIFIQADSISAPLGSIIRAAGTNGGVGGYSSWCGQGAGGGGGGSGGSIKIIAEGNINGTVSVTGGAGGSYQGNGAPGGSGSSGIYYKQ